MTPEEKVIEILSKGFDPFANAIVAKNYDKMFDYNNKNMTREEECNHISWIHLRMPPPSAIIIIKIEK